MMAVLIASLDCGTVNPIECREKGHSGAAAYLELMDGPEANSRAVQKQRLPGYVHGVTFFPVSDKSLFSKQLRAADL